MRRTASSYGATRVICEPMWQCRPASSSAGSASTRRTAAAAAPAAREKPNFWPSTPVAIAASWSISSKESTTTRPTWPAAAALRSSDVFALPCKVIRSGATPARRATEAGDEIG